MNRVAVGESQLRHRVAVYGSLKEGYGNHPTLGGADKVGDTELKGFRMVSLGAFPGIIHGEDYETVHVEVYDVTDDALRDMDFLEGHPSFYRRYEVNSPLGQVQVYVLPTEDYEDYEPVPGGLW